MKKEKKAFSGFNWMKLLKKLLRVGMILSLISLLVAGWATERQETLNDQILWETNSLTNAFGVFALILGWGFWEFFLIAKKRKIWLQIASIVLLVIATVLINGIMGIVSGSLAVGLVATSFALDYTGIIIARKSEQ